MASARKGAAGTAAASTIKPVAKPSKALFDKAKGLGIATRKNMTKATLLSKIAEAEAGGVAAPAQTAVAAEPKVRAKRGTAKKKAGAAFKLYAVVGDELSFISDATGINGKLAVQKAVQDGIVAPNTPVLALTAGTLDRAVEIEAVEREVKYVVKAAAKAKRKSPAKPKPEPAPVATADPVVAPDAASNEAILAPPTPPATPAPSARKAGSARKAPAKTANPFE